MLMENHTLERPLENIRKVETACYMAGQRLDNLLTETSERTERQYEGTSVYEQYCEQVGAADIGVCQAGNTVDGTATTSVTNDRKQTTSH